MKVSHEVPIPYLRNARMFNDYDYCLPHLLDESKEYHDYFLDSKRMHRYIVMDNSLHELGEPYDTERLEHWLHYFKPDEFIVPDYWQDKTSTLVSAKSWINRQWNEETTPVAVVQANNKLEARECYHILKMQGYRKIAFSYGADWYYDEGLKTTPNKDNKFVTKAQGRYNVIKEFFEDGSISNFDRVHLLGCNIPQEFSWYKNMPFIESIDTSNPVIHGLAGVKYKSYGLDEKLPYKVDKFEGNSKNWFLAIYNMRKFRDFIPEN